MFIEYKNFEDKEQLIKNVTDINTITKACIAISFHFIWFLTLEISLLYTTTA